jgi:hypothetical protein
MSSDSDFTPLVTRLRQDGLVVYGFGSAKAPEAFKTACTRYIDVDQLIRNDAADEAEAPQQAETAIDHELIDLLGAAWKAAKRDEDGFANLQEVGQIAGNRSSFDVRNHGFKRLADLMRAAEGHFRLEKRDGGRLYVKRVR